jgi:hypothetical protein
MATHCLPNGYLGTNELPVPNISGATITTYNPSGLRRGVIVLHHGLYNTTLSTPLPPGAVASNQDGTYSVFGSLYVASLCNNLAYDGWVVLLVPGQEDTYAANPSNGVQADVLADSANGLRYQNSTLHTWDHIYQYIQQTYGNWPIISGGISLGGWRSTTVAQYRPQQIVGSFSLQPASVFENLNNYITGWSGINFSGMNDTATELNTITTPSLIGYSSGDAAVWQGGNSTVATINGGTTAVAAASVTSLTVSGGSTAFYAPGVTGYVLLTGLTGGTGTQAGRAVYSYTGYSAGAFTGLTYQTPNAAYTGTPGSVGVGAVAVQAFTDSFITNAVAAGKSVTRNAGTDPHGVSLVFTGAYYNGSATTISAINTATTLQITTNQATTPTTDTNQCLPTGSAACAIMDNTGTWHDLTYSGITSPNMTGVSIAGSGSIDRGAPIVSKGTAITGGYSNMSIPYWVNTVIDPSYPKAY